MAVRCHAPDGAHRLDDVAHVLVKKCGVAGDDGLGHRLLVGLQLGHEDGQPAGLVVDAVPVSMLGLGDVLAAYAILIVWELRGSPSDRDVAEELVWGVEHRGDLVGEPIVRFIDARAIASVVESMPVQQVGYEEAAA